MPAHKPIELSRTKLKTPDSPSLRRAFSPLYKAADWISHLALVIYMFVVYFDALAQASDFRIDGETRIRTQESAKPFLLQTECPLTNRQSYLEILWLVSMFFFFKLNTKGNTDLFS